MPPASTAAMGRATASSPNYCAPQFRQMNNYTYGLRPEVRAELTASELDMFGFRPWSGYGHTGEVNARVIKPGAEALDELD